MKSLQTKLTFSLFVIILLFFQAAAAQPAPDTLFNNPEISPNSSTKKSLSLPVLHLIGIK